MLYIFKTPLDTHPQIPGKMVARRHAGECQTDCHAQVAICEHDPTIRHQKEGRYLLAIDRKRFCRGNPLTLEQEQALERNPDLLLFDKIEEHEEVIAEALDMNPREVVISPSFRKSNGRKITLADFPDNWGFGNGVTVGVTVPIRGSDPCVLSWAIFPASTEPAVQAAYGTLQRIMET